MATILISLCCWIVCEFASKRLHNRRYRWATIAAHLVFVGCVYHGCGATAAFVAYWSPNATNLLDSVRGNGKTTK